ncbi:MAG: Abi family protein [Metamycoplasmataceae bacterium]
MNQNNKIMIGNIDCSDYQEKFKVRSITRYKHLYKILKNKGYFVNDFNDLDHIFNRDIKIKLKLLKHLFYIENRLGAEIVNFLIGCEESFIDSIWDGNEFIRMRTNDNWFEEKVSKFNSEIEKIKNHHEDVDLLNLADYLTFGSKIHLLEILKNYIIIENYSKKIMTSSELKELKSFARYRNNITHNEFIYEESKWQLMKLLDSLEKHITKDYTQKFKEFYEYVEQKFI